MTQTRTLRPLGLVFVTIYTLVSGLLTLLASLLLVLAGGAFVPEWVPLAGLALLVFAVVLFTVSYGLAQLTDWAHPAAMWAYLASIPLALLSQAASGQVAGGIAGGGWVATLGTIMLSGAVLLYLSQRQVKALFPVVFVWPGQAGGTMTQRQHSSAPQGNQPVHQTPSPAAEEPMPTTPPEPAPSSVCAGCGRQLADHHKFCPACGAAQAVS